MVIYVFPKNQRSNRCNYSQEHYSVQVDLNFGRGFFGLFSPNLLVRSLTENGSFAGVSLKKIVGICLALQKKDSIVCDWVKLLLSSL